MTYEVTLEQIKQKVRACVPNFYPGRHSQVLNLGRVVIRMSCFFPAEHLYTAWAEHLGIDKDAAFGKADMIIANIGLDMPAGMFWVDDKEDLERRLDEFVYRFAEAVEEYDKRVRRPD